MNGEIDQGNPDNSSYSDNFEILNLDLTSLKNSDF